MTYRNEIKHIIGLGDKAAICANMRAIARSDEHTDEHGRYLIRSLYFDSPTNAALRQKIDGVSEREKFRIRLYNHDSSFIKLEKKVKRGGLGYKVTAPLTAEEAQRIVDGDIEWLPKSGRALLTELYSKMQSQMLRPKTIVDYERTPFVYPAGNVRVTIDENIRTGLNCTELLNPDCITVSAGEPVILLEVKWDEFLPDAVKRAVQIKNCRATAFSKYQICRIYG